METKTLKGDWNRICELYLEAFCVKHGYSYAKYVWVADNPGTVANIGDLFVGMEDMRYDVDNEIPKEYFEKWYWKNLEVYELTGCNYMNYSSFCKGAPDTWPEEKLERIRQAQKRVADAQKELDDEKERLKKENK